MMLKNMEKELQLLKRELAMHDTLANRSQVTYEPLSEERTADNRCNLTWTASVISTYACLCDFFFIVRMTELIFGIVGLAARRETRNLTVCCC